MKTKVKVKVKAKSVTGTLKTKRPKSKSAKFPTITSVVMHHIRENPLINAKEMRDIVVKYFPDSQYVKNSGAHFGWFKHQILLRKYQMPDRVVKAMENAKRKVSK